MQNCARKPGKCSPPSALPAAKIIIRASFPADNNNASRLRALLINDPEVVLADEPTGNLDSRTSVEIMDIFQKLNERGITIVMVTHETGHRGFRETQHRDARRDGPNRSAGRTAADCGKRNEEFGDREMKVDSTFKIAFRALRRNKLRSVLTALGIIIGVGAVIAMVSIGNGAKAQVEQQIASLGENVILIFSGSVTSSGIRTGWGSAGTLKIEDAEAIRREVPGVIAVSEEVISTRQVSAGNQNWFTRIYGESPEYFDIRQWPLSDGAIFTAAGCAEREQGLRDRADDREPGLRLRKSNRPGLAHSKVCLFSSPACSRRKGSARRERTRTTSSSCPTRVR